MKHLKIEYNNIVLWDAPIDEVQFSDGPNGIAVAGKIARSNQIVGSTGGGIGGFLQKLADQSKTKTAEYAEEKRAEYESDCETVDSEE